MELALVLKRNAYINIKRLNDCSLKFTTQICQLAFEKNCICFVLILMSALFMLVIHALKTLQYCILFITHILIYFLVFRGIRTSLWYFVVNNFSVPLPEKFMGTHFDI